MTHLRTPFVTAAFALVCAFGALPAAHAAHYAVTIDTVAIAGSSGSVDFQWNPALLDPPLAASVSSFAGAAVTVAPVVLSGTASGSLGAGGQLLFDGGEAFSYVYQDLMFGSSLRFDVSLPDAAPVASGLSFDSGFFVALLGPDQLSALPTASADQQLLAFTLAPGGAPVAVAYSDAVRIAAVSAVPEPASVALMAGGLLLLALRQRRR